MDSNTSNTISEKRSLEKYSSAFTLSDMEIFIFPDLFYPLILANIMSPIIWRWRDDPWFKDIEKKSFNNKANRIKQYIIQNYVFNLDLSTWGLTSKENEISRFSDFFDIELLKQSNALFGYEGDKYYFEIDIRKHFGLDKFDSDIIPYWKTETIEAMTAFRYKDGFSSGAGECVSLSALYAAAMFIIGRVPIEKIYLIATPLHSQNFIIEKEGLITNNRRIVTKNMWYNGTSLSEKARRAMENEKVTIISHISGYIHTLYNEATIDEDAYSLLSGKLREYLSTELTNLILINFLRFKSKYKTLFQYQCELSGKLRYISLEKMFEYEHTSKFNVSAESRSSLLKEIDGDEFHLSKESDKILLNDIEVLLDNNASADIKTMESAFLKIAGAEFKDIIHEMFSELQEFIQTIPRLPSNEKLFKTRNSLYFTPEDSRDKIISRIVKDSNTSELSLLALYVYRDMDKIDWVPFIKASIERNPACFTDLTDLQASEVYDLLISMPNQSIYEGNRLALPDEVWNFKRGDGIEKAILFADYLINMNLTTSLTIEIKDKKVAVKTLDNHYNFLSEKQFRKLISLEGGSCRVE